MLSYWLRDNLRWLGIILIWFISIRWIQVRPFNRAYRKMSGEEQSRYNLKKIRIWGYIITSFTWSIWLALVLVDKFTPIDILPYFVVFLIAALMPLWYMESTRDFLNRFCKK
ncbi:MAG: hypothetical protein Q4F11_02185 [Eubacteriales bacterium]|nr:hypothetical protein [Eubacteriales bacterium]